MSASTVVANSANSDLTNRNAIRQSRQRALYSGRPFGLYLFDTGTISIPTTSIDDVNDRTRLLRLPSGTWGVAYRLTSSDMDTNVSPLLTFALESDDEAASPTRVSIATGLVGGKTGVDDAAFFAGPVNLDGLTVNLLTTAVAATAAAGTVRLRLWVYLDQTLVSANQFA